MPTVETVTPPNTPTPIGPYSHVAKVGGFITIGGTAGVDPATGQLAGSDVASQTRQILRNFGVMLEAVGSDLGHVIHVDVFLLDIADFGPMNEAYVEAFAPFGGHRPARTAIGVAALPKDGAVVTMGLTAVVAD
jgi:2-iminobutanoate/2-iminopropanoate deaminase